MRGGATNACSHENLNHLTTRFPPVPEDGRPSGPSTIWPAFPLVLRKRRVDLIGPSQNAARQVGGTAESRLAQKLYCLSAATTHLAMHYDLAAGIQLTNPFGQVVQRDQMSADVADLVFVGLANIEDVYVFSRDETALEF